MGVKQSKRSLDITEASTKGEIEGFGNEGKVEKIIDGVVEKVAANGHVDGELQNGGESHQNGMEAVQNGEAATVAVEVAGGKVEKIDADEAGAEGAVNGQVENGEINGEAEKTGEEAKKSEEKKEKKKEKKEKVLKKKFSFRNFSFSKKDKSKPKEEKSPGKMDEAGIEETPSSPEKEAVASPTSNDMEIPEIPKVEEVAQQEMVSSTVEIPAEVKVEQPTAEKIPEMVSSTTAAIVEDLPPPLPASPPPSEPVKEIQEVAVKTENDLVAAATASSTNILDATAGVLKDAEQMAIETGKQIEEKATNLLKTVEERAEESMKTAGEMITQKTQELAEGLEKALTIGTDEKKMESEPETKTEEMIQSFPVEVANVESVTAKTEETTDKIEESGGGESLADVPKDLIENVAEGTIEGGVNPDSLEISEPLPPPPPPVEAATGE